MFPPAYLLNDDMITTAISQRSFDNSWMSPLANRGDSQIPQGVVLDLCVTCPTTVRLSTGAAVAVDYVQLRLSVAVAGSVSAELVAVSRDGANSIIGTLTTNLIGIPVAFECSQGVYGSILLGFIPTVPAQVTYDSARISDDLIIFHDLPSNGHSLRALTINTTNNDQVVSSITVPLVENKSIELDPGVMGELDGDACLQLSYDPTIINPWMLSQPEDEVSATRGIQVIGGARAVKAKDTVSVKISYAGEPVAVVGYPSDDNAQLAVIDTSDVVSACDVVDPVDDYVGPYSYHEGVQVLDELYADSSTARDIERLFMRSYGWGVSESLEKPTGCVTLADPDDAFDKVEAENEEDEQYDEI